MRMTNEQINTTLQYKNKSNLFGLSFFINKFLQMKHQSIKINSIFAKNKHPFNKI